MKRYLFILSLLFIWLTSFTIGIDHEFTFPVVNGITFEHSQSDTTGILHNINIIKIDYHRNDLQILAATATRPANTLT